MHEVVIGVSACGLCGTDLHILHERAPSLPIVPGHEFCERASVVEQEERQRS
jgi:D-arabinose 1-dehydrogenase-like Zn-dependent alcohol dehydrogenase